VLAKLICNPQDPLGARWHRFSDTDDAFLKTQSAIEQPFLGKCEFLLSK
jgi:hypothetical protein